MTGVDSNGLYNGIPIEESGYNYLPTRWVAIVFLALFAISTLAHIAQAVRYRMWYLLYTAVLCGIIEILGWSGRLWSSWNPFLDTPFQIQITCTIIGPTPLLAAVFVVFGIVIDKLGPVYSRLTPKWYTIIFCTCDVIALVIQGVGGGLAASAENLVDANKGGNIMLGGIIFQLIVVVVFTICACDFMIHYIGDYPVRTKDVQPEGSGSSNTSRLGRGLFTLRRKLMVSALGFMILVLFIRAIYRTVELSDGWNGRIISTQVYFDVLDGAMVILAIYALNIAHPGLLLADSESQEKQAIATV